MATLEKTPAEVTEYEFDFSEFAVGGAITSFSIGASQSGLTLVRAAMVGSALTIALSGGLPDWNFIVGATAFRGDLADEQRLEVQVRGELLDEIGEGETENPTTPTGGLLLGTTPILFGTSYITLS